MTEARMKDLLIRLLVATAILVVIVIAVSWVVAAELPKAATHDIGRPPLDLEASNVTFASRSGTLLHGWLSPGKAGHGVVLLLHGFDADRRSMLARAEFLHRLGFWVLLFDFQAHGESHGPRTTFGDQESRDVVAAIQYLQFKLPQEHVGVIAVALGADAFVLAEDRPPVAAVVLESPFPTLEKAVASRLRLHLGPFGPLLAPLISMQLASRLGIDASRLELTAHMARIGAPLLLVNGTRDKHTSIEGARALFAAASAPKELWAVEGADHTDLYKLAAADYERRIGEFLQRYLRQDAAGN